MSNALKAIRTERAYQNDHEETTGTRTQKPFGDFLVYTRGYMNMLLQAHATVWDNGEHSLHLVRKVASLVVAYFEDHETNLSIDPTAGTYGTDDSLGGYIIRMDEMLRESQMYYNRGSLGQSKEMFAAVVPTAIKCMNKHGAPLRQGYEEHADVQN